MFIRVHPWPTTKARAPVATGPGLHLQLRDVLGAERAAASARRFHVWIVELKAGSLHRLDIIDLGAVQVKEAGLIDETFRPSKL